MTFLTTSKMDPALAGRIEASVRGRPAGRSRVVARSHRLVSIARGALVLGAIVGVIAVIVARRDARRAHERAKDALLEKVAEQRTSVSPSERGAVARIEPWILAVRGSYEGDRIADELLAPKAMSSTLAQPIVYLRGAADALGSSREIAAAASTSLKDAFVLCLLEPPESRAEKALLDKVRVAYSGGWNLESRTPNVRRLNDAVVGLPFLAPEWSEKVRATDDPAPLARFRAELERAPIERGKAAARAGLALFAIDEAGDGAGPTEVDGERIHPVRVVLVDLRANEVLLRVRHVVDPAWITPARRVTYAIGLDSCALSLDVLEDVRNAASSRRAPGR